MHQSPSALSKAIRRIETTIHTAIFDRIGKTIRLNVDGERLRYRARTLIALADETQAEFRGDRQQLHCRVVGPPLLQWRFAAILANVLTANFPQSGITFGEKFEDTAVVALTQGHADFALIPAAAVNASLPTGIEVLPLGTITMQLVAANSHPIIAAMSDVQRRKPRVSAATVLKHEFACPNHWQFCGIDQGARSDGWRDDKLPAAFDFGPTICN